MSLVCDDLALGLECPYCQAGPGFWCVTSSGCKATWLHAGRTDLVQQAYAEGYLQGQADERAWAKERFERGPFG